jgi:hypothetical protein
MPGGRFLGVECKGARGRLSPEQKAFGEAVAERGGVYVVARSVADLEGAGL